jgi:malonate-semialdehyde dehydrogenase (acetylating)/methylmalonate-semialdehyde dehydrogenase
MRHRRQQGWREKDPSSTTAIADLWREAGLPDGIMNVVDRDQEALYALLVNPDVRRSPS